MEESWNMHRSVHELREMEMGESMVDEARVERFVIHCVSPHVKKR